MGRIITNSSGQPMISIGKSDKYQICPTCKNNISIQYSTCTCGQTLTASSI